MDQFSLTLYNLDKTGYKSGSEIFYKHVKEACELAKFLNHYANNNGLGLVKVENDKYRVQIVSSELSFILVFLNFFENCCYQVRNGERDKYFVLGNSRYAFSNNQALTCYVPHLKRAYKHGSVAANDLNGEAPNSVIIEMVHCTLYQFMELIEDGQINPSRLWSPFDEDKFFETTDFEINQSRKQNFKELLAKRIESKIVYVEELLTSINNAKDFDYTSRIKCSDADGMPVIIDSSKIAAIVPESDPWDLIIAKIVIPNDTIIRVNLCSFVKELTGFELTDYRLPKNLLEQSQEDDNFYFKEAKKLSSEIIKTFNEYQIKTLQESNPYKSGATDADEDDVFNSDWDEDDDVFHPDDTI